MLCKAQEKLFIYGTLQALLTNLSSWITCLLSIRIVSPGLLHQQSEIDPSIYIAIVISSKQLLTTEITAPIHTQEQSVNTPNLDSVSSNAL